MKAFVTSTLSVALQQLVESGALSRVPETLELERPKQASHGDLASNVALLLAKDARCKPRELAERIVAAMPASPHIARCEIAGPGFINFFLRPEAFQEVVRLVYAQGERFGAHDFGEGETLHLEFVSANPTGPLHVGHGRGAAYGASLANLLRFCGYRVFCEYYVNDAGRQMDILAASVYLRYLENAGLDLPWPYPSNAYRGDYLLPIAAALRREFGLSLIHI